MNVHCPGCARPMAPLLLPAGDGRALEVDHCAACRLVWFDAKELAALGREGWIRLLGAVVETDDDARPVLPPASSPRTGRCPRCDDALTTTHNRTKFGDFTGLACPRRHGEAQRDGSLLASRGLFRALLPAEHAALEAEDRALTCQACGAGLPRLARACTHCQAPVVVADVPRLAQALGLREALASRPTSLPRPRLWSCHACGGSVDITRQAACGQCKHPVLAPRLSDLRGLLGPAVAALPELPRQLASDPASGAGAWRPWQRMGPMRVGLRYRSPFEGLGALTLVFLGLLALAWWVGPR